MATSPDSDSEPTSDSLRPVRAIWLSAPQEAPPVEDSGPDGATPPAASAVPRPPPETEDEPGGDPRPAG